MINNNEIIEMINIIDNAIGKYYDIETIINNIRLNDISMNIRDLKQIRLKKYKHIKLININGLGDGQVHFVTDDGHYLMLPWCYIISIIPSEEA